MFKCPYNLGVFWLCCVLVLGPAKLDKGKEIMVNTGGPTNPFCSLTMGPAITSPPKGGKPVAAGDLSDDSSSDESIFLGVCML